MKGQALNSIEEQVLPRAIELEKAVLGAIMVEPGALSKVLGILQADCFYLPVHREIFNEIVRLDSSHRPVDLLTVAQGMLNNVVLKDNGGMHYLSGLTSLVAGGTNIGEHARIIKQRYIARELMLACDRIKRSAHDPAVDVADVMDGVNGEIDRINAIVAGEGGMKHVRGVIKGALEAYEVRRDNRAKGVFTGIPTGFMELDEMTGGWQEGQFVVIGARPSMGKTAVGLNMVKAAARNGIPACVYSLEMSDVSLANRLLLSECDISAERFKSGELTDMEIESLHKAAGRLQGLPIYIDDKPSVTINYIRNHSRLMHKKGKCGLIVVDYLQLTGSQVENNRNREQEVSNISRTAKIIAKELKVPFVMLSQLNRECEKRTDKKPMLADLRESGSIEQDADVICLLYRPGYYKIEDIEYGNSRVSSKGVGVLIVAKQRDGKTGYVFFRHNPSMTKFYPFKGGMPF
ncbi:replicative DNA helicase [uncultured Butyricimonas sp.]|uniref:replicative DNA helicase n=1 Tax=uncultured Butyricimonas sp. TaxID=1268785 RepID=UPI0026DAEDAD|nr:replicative DNA helicase [uncultured Butyricimonas sp.]